MSSIVNLIKSKRTSLSRTQILYILAFLSGFSGISYEILFGRMIANVIGEHFVVSASILTIFLFGIGIGSFFSSQVRNRLWVIELSIGLYAILSIVSLSLIKKIYYLPFFPVNNDVMNFVFCFLLLIVPTMLIGATLPVYSAVSQTQSKSTSVFSSTYALYNLGAASICIITEYLLIRVFGLLASFIFSGVVNILIAVVLRTCISFDEDSSSRSILSKSFASVISSIRKSKKSIFSLFILSIASAVFQLSQVKINEYLLGHFRENFAILLSIVLLNITLGAVFVNKFKLSFRLIMIYAISSIILCNFTLSFTVGWYVAAYPVLAKSYLGALLLKFTFLWLINVPSIWFGASIPAILEEPNYKDSDPGFLLGLASFGNLIGYLFMFFVLYNYLEMGSILFAVVFLCLIALAFSFSASHRWIRTSFLIVLFGIGLAFFSKKYLWQEKLLYVGFDNLESGSKNYLAIRSKLNEVQKFKENFSTLALVHSEKDQSINFMIDGYTSIDLVRNKSEYLVGALSTAFAPSTDQALVLGVGSGMTSGTVGLFFDRVDAVDISQAIIKNQEALKDYNFGIHKNPKVSLINDDAIRFIHKTQKKYSLILNTVTSPRYFSSSKLYTIDFLRSVKDHLSENGVYTSWFDGRIGKAGTNIIFNTFSQVFNVCSLGAIKWGYFLLVCSDRYPIVQNAHFLGQNEVFSRKMIEEFGIHPDLIPSVLVNRNVFNLRNKLETRINSLDNPVVEFLMSWTKEQSYFDFLEKVLDALNPVQVYQATRPDIVVDSQTADMRNFIIMNSLLHSKATQKSITEKLISILKPQNDLSANELIQNYRLQYYQDLVKKYPSAKTYYYLGVELKEEQKMEEALAAFDGAYQLDPKIPSLNYELGYINYYHKNDLPRALKYFEAETYDLNWAIYFTGRIYKVQRDLDKALSVYQRILAMEVDPDLVLPKLVEVSEELGDSFLVTTYTNQLNEHQNRKYSEECDQGKDQSCINLGLLKIKMGQVKEGRKILSYYCYEKNAYSSCRSLQEIVKSQLNQTLDERNEFGNSQLAVAVSDENEELAIQMVNDGADAFLKYNYQGFENKTIFEVALEKKMKDLVQTILNAKNRFGNSPLVSAVFLENEDLAIKLLKTGASLSDPVNCSGFEKTDTILSVAQKNGLSKFVAVATKAAQMKMESSRK